jgi:TolB protein
MAKALGWRRGWIGVLAGLLAVGSAASGAGGAALAAGRTAYLLGAGQTGPRSAVPWPKVGPGWVLAIDWPGNDGFFNEKVRAAVPVLYLFDPAGGRYRLYQWPKTKNPPLLWDWSGDGSRALIFGPADFEQIVLATGKVSRVRLPKNVVPISYTRPAGPGLLTWRVVRHKTQLSQYDLDGRLATVLLPDADGVAAVYSDSGAVLAVNAPRGIWLVSSKGGVSRKLPVPGSGAGCAPSRWWDSRTVLAWCKATKKTRSRLWLVPADGAKPTPLTGRRGDSSADFGDIGAWSVHGSLYLQEIARSGQWRIFRQPTGRPSTRVRVPHVPNSDEILTSQGSRLLVGAFGLSSDHVSLLWINPAIGREQMLINTRSDLAGCEGAVPFGGQRLAEFFTSSG